MSVQPQPVCQFVDYLVVERDLRAKVALIPNPEVRPNLTAPLLWLSLR